MLIKRKVFKVYEMQKAIMSLHNILKKKNTFFLFKVLLGFYTNKRIRHKFRYWKNAQMTVIHIFAQLSSN